MKKILLLLSSALLFNVYAELPSCVTDHEIIFISGGVLKAFNPTYSTVRTIRDPYSGSIKDPHVGYDGINVYVSMRTSEDDNYHIYRISSSSGSYSQMTHLEGVDDTCPVRLPYSRYAFCSTREPKFEKDGRSRVSNLFHMTSYGLKINQISRSEYSESDLSVMSDGRLLYTRQGASSSSLWTCEPKGTSHSFYYGSTNGSHVAQGREVPGTPYVVCSIDDQVSVIDHRLGMYSEDAVIHSWADTGFTDPYPLVDSETGIGGRYFLCAKGNGLYLLDVEGFETLLHSESETVSSPMPLAERQTPPNLQRYSKYNESNGRFFVLDVYEGTQMEGINRGDAKYLRVVEIPEKRTYTDSEGWEGDVLQSPAMNWSGGKTARVLGVVPVEEDGSAHFNCPPHTLVNFQLLDENKMMLQSMQSGTIIRPSESYGCIGCHDDRTKAPAGAFNASVPLATMRDPSQLTLTNTVSYVNDIQTIWDDNCLTCHDFGRSGAGAVVLAADKTLFFNVSYTELLQKGYVVTALPGTILQPKSWGSHASGLMTQLRTGHGNLSDDELEKIAEWLDLNAPYYPEFGSSFPNNLAGRSPLTDAQLTELDRKSTRLNSSH